MGLYTLIKCVATGSGSQYKADLDAIQPPSSIDWFFVFLIALMKFATDVVSQSQEMFFWNDICLCVLNQIAAT